MVIAAPAVFRATHLPQDLRHRTREIAQLVRRLEPAVNGGSADALVTGGAGAGKTALTRYVCRQLEASGDVAPVRVSCAGHSEADVLRRICAALGLDVDDRWVVSDFRERLREVSSPTVVVLDEADDVPGTLVGSLADAPSLSVVAIALDGSDWRSRLDSAHRERFADEGWIHLEPYGASALADVLERRATQGLVQGSWTREVLERIAADADGDARAGVQTLYEAATVAEERGRDAIRPTDVQTGLERARARVLAETLAELSVHHQVLYAIVADAGELHAGDLHDRYEAIGDEVYRNRVLEPTCRRTRRKHLSKLAGYGFLESEGVNRHRRYRVSEPIVDPPLSLDLASALDDR